MSSLPSSNGCALGTRSRRRLSLALLLARWLEPSTGAFSVVYQTWRTHSSIRSYHYTLKVRIFPPGHTAHLRRLSDERSHSEKRVVTINRKLKYKNIYPS